MIKTFAEIEETLIRQGKRAVVALAGSNDSYSIRALELARRKGLVKAILIGNKAETLAALAEAEVSPDNFELVACDDDDECARRAVAMVHEGTADMPMKGLLQTSSYMHAILNKEVGLLPKGGLLSQSTLVEKAGKTGFFQVTDCAINIAPGYEQKADIVRNAVCLAHSLGCECPRVAMVSAIEKVNPKIPSTVEAHDLRDAWKRGEFDGCVIDGPLALDNAISEEAAQHKGIDGEVAGHADILVMPDLCAGNILTKSLTFYAHMTSAGCLLGTTTPVIATSRTDTPENKYNGILVSLLHWMGQQVVCG